MRSYIRDLDEQIFLQHIHYIKTNKDLEPFTVYRGFGMFDDDFKKLKNEGGGFMSFAEFLCTSRDELLGRGFALANVGLANKVGILLKIKLGENSFHSHFTDTQRQSWVPNEEEVLFTMGTVFRIQSIDPEPDENDIKTIELSLTGEEDKELKFLYEHMRKDFMKPSPLSNLAKLMFVMGKYELAEQYYNLLLQDSEFIADVCNLSDVHYNLGRISTVLNQQEKAITHYEKSVDIKKNFLSTTSMSPAVILVNLGDICREQEDYEKALSYFKQALDIESNASIQDQNKLAAIYNSLGVVYYELQRYSEEIDMFEKALKIRLKLYQQNHPIISESYSNIATGYAMQKNFKKAIDLYNKAIEIQLKSLPSNHPTLADTYYNLATTLYDYNKRREAIEYAKKAYEIHTKNLSSNHPKLKKILKLITDAENEQ